MDKSKVPRFCAIPVCYVRMCSVLYRAKEMEWNDSLSMRLSFHFSSVHFILFLSLCTHLNVGEH